MIYIVQVYPYQTNNGCSVRIGRGIDINERLIPSQCSYYEFVETHNEVHYAIKVIRKLPHHYRNINDSLDKLYFYLDNYVHE